MKVCLWFLYVSLKAHGLWYLALGRRLSAVGIKLWGSRTELTAPTPHLGTRCKGSLVEPLGAKWPPKAAKEDPKADTERPKVAKVRPDVDYKAPSTEKSQNKLSEAWPRAAPNLEKCKFSLSFRMFR